MSIFASQTQTTVAVPFDPPQAQGHPHTVTIRKLTGREVQQAQLEDMFGMVAGNSRTWAARMKRMAATGDPDALKALADPLIGYDRFTVIRAGLVAWTYPLPLTPVPEQPAVPAKDGHPARAAVPAYDAIADLDDETADFLAREILKITKPALFLPPADLEAARKNG